MGEMGGRCGGNGGNAGEMGGVGMKGVGVIEGLSTALQVVVGTFSSHDQRSFKGSPHTTELGGFHWQPFGEPRPKVGAHTERPVAPSAPQDT